MYSDRKNLVFILIFIGVMLFVFKAVQMSFALKGTEPEVTEVISECTDENPEGCEGY